MNGTEPPIRAAGRLAEHRAGSSSSGGHQPRRRPGASSRLPPEPAQLDRRPVGHVGGQAPSPARPARLRSAVGGMRKLSPSKSGRSTFPEAGVRQGSAAPMTDTRSPGVVQDQLAVSAPAACPGPAESRRRRPGWRAAKAWAARGRPGSARSSPGKQDLAGRRSPPPGPAAGAGSGTSSARLPLAMPECGRGVRTRTVTVALTMPRRLAGQPEPPVVAPAGSRHTKVHLAQPTARTSRYAGQVRAARFLTRLQQEDRAAVLAARRPHRLQRADRRVPRVPVVRGTAAVQPSVPQDRPPTAPAPPTSHPARAACPGDRTRSPCRSRPAARWPGINHQQRCAAVQLDHLRPAPGHVT